MVGNVVDVLLRAKMDTTEAIAGIGSIKKVLNGLSLPKGIADGFTKQFDKLNPLLRDYQRQLDKGFKTSTDLKNFEMLQREIGSIFNDIGNQIQQLNGQKIILKADAKEIENVEKKLANAKSSLQKSFDNLYKKNQTKSSILNGLDQFAAALPGTASKFKSMIKDITSAFSSGNFASANNSLEQLKNRFDQLKDGTKIKIAQALGFKNIGNDVDIATKKVRNFLTELQTDKGNASGIEKYSLAVKILSSDLERIKTDALARGIQAISSSGTGLNQISSSFQQIGQASSNAASGLLSMQDQVGQLKYSTQYFFSLRNMINLLKRGIDQAIESVKNLDAAMTETAVVTEFSVGDMWEKLPQYTANANALGATVQDMYESTTLYYQQGLNTEQSMGIAAETMKMARIGGLEAAEATDMMTAALRGFNMELNETSAQRINDVYSQLAAKTASNTKELGSAMQRTASIANSAGMSFEGTAAFLAQAIETTREPAENIGTAMKTIVARFQEMKQNPLELVDVEGEEVSYNRVDKALQSIGVSLKDTNGQFRANDEVFLDISKKWDSLTQTQQRYIATTAAGSRQQSRFIAMVDNYQRVTELMTYANDSAGASQEQFNKTLESFEAKVNQLKNAWQAFTMGIMDNSFVKGAVDGLTGILEITNKLIDRLSFGSGAIKSFLSVMAGFATLKFGGRIANAAIGGLGGAIDPNSSFIGGIKNGMFGAGGMRNQAAAHAISNPIVKAIHDLIPHIDKNANIPKDLNYKYQDRGNYKGAREQLKSILKPSKGKYSVNDLLSIVDNNKLNKQQQQIFFQQSQGLKTNLTKNLGKIFAAAGADPKVSKSLIQGFKTGGLALDEALIQGGVLTDRNAKYQEILQNSGKQAAHEYRRGLLEEGKQKGLRGKELRNFARSVVPNSKELGGLLSEQQQLTNSEKIANWGGKLGAGLTQMGTSLQMIGAQLHTVNPLLGSLVSGLGSVAMTAGSVAQAVPALIRLGPAAGIATAAVMAIGAAIILEQKRIDGIRKKATKVTKDFERTRDETENNISALEDYKDELATLSKGVDSNGNNVNLDNADYKRYLEIVDSIAKMNPEIVKGYNAQGHAIIDNNRALSETLTLQKQIQKEATDTYTSQKSLQKLIDARKTKKGFLQATATDSTLALEQLGYRRGNVKGINKTTSDSKQAFPLSSQVSRIGTIIDANNDKFFDPQTIAAIEALGISIDGLREGNEKDVKRFIKYNDKITEVLNNTARRTGEDIPKSMEKAMGKYTSAEEKYLKAIKPEVDNLKTYISNTDVYKDLNSELQTTLMSGVENIVMTPELDAKGMQTQATQMASELSDLTDSNSKYAEAMLKVKDAQEDYSQSLNEGEYYNTISEAVSNLSGLLADYEDEETAYSQGVAEFLRNKIAEIQNFTTSGAETITEALNTMTSEISLAEGALETFKEKTETDYSTAADNMKSIYDTLYETYEDSSGTKRYKHLEGEGDQTFWTGAQTLLGEERLTGGIDNVKKKLKEIEPWLKEGKEGVDNFYLDVLNNKNLKKLQKEGLKLTEKGWFEEIPDDLYDDVANSLGVSEELLTSMLNKARQFGLIQFTNLEEVRKSLSGAEYAIQESESSIKYTDEEGRKRLYVNEQRLRGELFSAGYTNRDAQDKQLAKLRKEQNVYTIDPDKITKNNAGKYAEAFGATNAEDLMSTLIKTGDWQKSQVLDFVEKANLANGQSRENLSDTYEQTVAGLENPELSEQTSQLMEANATLANIQAALDSQDAKSLEDNVNTLIEKDKEDVKKTANAFSKGQDINGKTLSPEEYTAQKKELEEAQTKWNNIERKAQAEFNVTNNKHEQDILKKVIETAQEQSKIYSDALTKGPQAYNEAKAKDAEKKAKETVSKNKFLDEASKLYSKEEYIAKIRDAKATSKDTSSLTEIFPSLGQNQTDEMQQAGKDLGMEGANAFIKGVGESSSTKPFVNNAILETRKKAEEEKKQIYEQYKNGLISKAPSVNEIQNKVQTTAKNLWDKFKTGIKGDSKGVTKTGTSKTPTIQHHDPKQIEKSSSNKAKIDTDTSLIDKVKKQIDKIKEAGKKAIKLSIKAKTDSSFNKASTAINNLQKKAKKKTTVPIKANVSGKKDLGVLNDIITKMPKSKSVNVKAKLGNSITQVSNYNAELNRIPDKKTTTIETIKITKTKSSSGKGNKNGEGGTSALGSNNKIHSYSLPSFGSMAGGSRYGRLGPKGNGGLTLTGEKGFEIAWLPSESRSMILGADGPQMLNLPSDAVVYTHEQSKKIIGQKGIPAGSHSDPPKTKVTGSDKNYTVGYGSNNATVNINVTSDSSKKSGGKDKTDKTDKTASKAEKVVVWWENITRRADAVQRRADKNQKSYEKYLAKVGATLKQTGVSVKDGGGGGNAFIKNTNTALKLYNKQLKRATQDLKNYNKGVKKSRTKKAYYADRGGAVRISYEKGGKTKNQYISTGKYVQYDPATGGYVLNAKALKKVKNTNKRAAIKNTITDEINDRISKRTSAEDNIEKAKESLTEFGEKLYETFKGWENELTKIWNLTQQIESLSNKVSRAESAVKLYESQLANGTKTASTAMSKLISDAYKVQIGFQVQSIKQTGQLIKQYRAEINRLYSTSDETKRINSLKKAIAQDKVYDAQQTIKQANKTLKSKKATKAQKKQAKKDKKTAQKTLSQNKGVKGKNLSDTTALEYTTELRHLTDSRKIINQAKKYLGKTTRNTDGTLNIDFNSAALEKDKNKGDVSSTDYEQIKKYVDSLQAANNSLNEQYRTLTEQLTSLQDELKNLQDQYADDAESLVSDLEAMQQKELDKLKKLSDSLTDALKKLIEEIRKRLDQRRQEEDNKKTEAEISQKQQRLAALRADTTGGHQVEILQLQKEIADAQESYQRSLEDQLLDRLQKQGDEAAEQRERQIALQEALIDSTNNVAQVNMWLAALQNPNTTEAQKNSIRAEMLKAYRAANDYDDKTNAMRAKIDNDFNALFGRIDTYDEKTATLTSAISDTKTSIETVKTSIDALNQTLQPSGSTTSKTSTNGGAKVASKGNEGKGKGSTYTIGTGTGKTSALAVAAAKAKDLAKEAVAKSNTKLQIYNETIRYAADKGLTAGTFQQVITAANNAGLSARTYLKDLALTKLSWQQVIQAAKNAKFNKQRLAITFSSNAFKTGFDAVYGKGQYATVLKKAQKSQAKPYAYEQGGLADFTGPAWLDGTKAKPELVLDAQDTKNFIALRDVLSRALGSARSIGGTHDNNTSYEININVDKIEKDYDVDRMADRIKKIIVKDASYRNVTQVSRLR